MGSPVSISGNPEVEKVRDRKRARDRETRDWDSNRKGRSITERQDSYRRGGSGCHKITASWEPVEVMHHPLYNCQVEGGGPWYSLVLESSIYLTCFWSYDLEGHLTCLSLSLLCLEWRDCQCSVEKVTMEGDCHPREWICSGPMTFLFTTCSNLETLRFKTNETHVT